MSMRGVHFAITDDDLRALCELPGNEERINYIGNVVEEAWGANFAAETDKAWGTIHSTLTGSNPCSGQMDLNLGFGSSNICPFGEEQLISEDVNYIIGLIRNTRVRDIRDALDAISRDVFADRLRVLIAKYGCEDLDEEDVAYAADWFENMKTVYRAAVDHGRHVIFTVDW